MTDGNGLQARVRQLTEELRIVKEKNLALTLANRDREKKDMEM